MSVDDVVITQEEIEAIRERAKKATEGKWELADTTDGAWIVDDDGDIISGTCERIDDATFIAHARQDIPKLLAEIERLRNAISWGVSCSGCSNQLAEDWEIIGTSFVCRECIEYGGDSE